MVSDLSRVHDAPLCTVTWLSHHHLVQNAADDGCLVVFSGLGGDEGLAGEYEHFLYFFADLKAQGREERLEAEIDAWARLHDHPLFKKNRRVVEDAFRRLVDLDRPGRTFIDRDRYFADQDAFDPDFLAQGPPPPEPDCPFESYLANRCYQDLVYETTPPSLDADAKNTGAHGLVSRFPFLDHRLVSFCYSLAPTVKYDHGATKAVMRRAMTGRLPEANRTNLVKTGFNAPLNQWLLTDQRRDFLDLMRSRSFQQRGWLKPGAFDRLWQEHQSGQKNHMMLFWQLLSAELWLRTLAD
jgi:asparagine synthase (glutamine-hydrolysing)